MVIEGTCTVEISIGTGPMDTAEILDLPKSTILQWRGGGPQQRARLTDDRLTAQESEATTDKH